MLAKPLVSPNRVRSTMWPQFHVARQLLWSPLGGTGLCATLYPHPGHAVFTTKDGGKSPPTAAPGSRWV